jgi:hypothetical protein
MLRASDRRVAAEGVAESWRRWLERITIWRLVIDGFGSTLASLPAGVRWGLPRTGTPLAAGVSDFAQVPRAVDD